MDGDAAQVVTAPLTLAGVERGTDAESHRRRPIADCAGASYGLAWLLESREKAIAHCLYFPAVVAGKFDADRIVMAAHLVPTPHHRDNCSHRHAWAEKFGRHVADDIRKRSAGKLGDKWHLDEAVITITGKKHFLARRRPVARQGVRGSGPASPSASPVGVLPGEEGQSP